MFKKKILALPIISAFTLMVTAAITFQAPAQAQELYPPCPDTQLSVSHHVGGWQDPTQWITPTWSGGDWVFSSTIQTKLEVPYEGKENWLDVWVSGSVLRITEGSITTTHASYHCVDEEEVTETPETPEVPEAPENPEVPEEPTPESPNTTQRQACTKDCPPCPASQQEVALISNGLGTWEAPTWEGGSWKFISTTEVTLTVPMSGSLDWLDYWASQPVSTSLGSIFVSEASYTCQPLVVKTPEEPELPADPNTEQRQPCSENCPQCPVTSQDVAKFVSNGEGEWTAPEGDWGAWSFTSSEPMTLTVPMSGTLDWIDYWASQPVSTSIGLVTNVTEASYTCIEPEQELVKAFLPFLAVPKEEEIPTEEVPTQPVVQSPWSCFNSNEEAAQALGGDYWDWTPPKESEPWASWVFSSPFPEEVCHPGGSFGGFLEHFSLGRLESGCYPQPIQDASYTCEDVED